MSTIVTEEEPEWKRPFTQIYSLDIYLAVDAEIDTDDKIKQMQSFLKTNVVMEILNTELLQPLAKIPNLAERINKKGPVEPEIITKVEEVLQKFPSFWLALSTQQLGQSVQGKYADLVTCANKLLYAHGGRNFLLSAAPLINVLVLYLVKTKNFKKDQASLFLARCVQGSLIEAVGKIAESLRTDLVHRADQCAVKKGL